MSSKKKLIIEPERWPFYYGWWLLFLGVVATIISMPGQTAGVSSFTEPLLKILGISREALSLAYLLGTLASALLLTKVGKLYDRFGIRSIIIPALFLFSLVLAILSFANQILGDKPLPLVSFVFIFMGFFSIRFLGQGVLTTLSRNMAMKWFLRYRGAANAALGAGLTLATTLGPQIFDQLIMLFGVAGAWRMTALVILGVLLLFWVFARDNPQDCDLPVDGFNSHKKLRHRNIPSYEPPRSFTLQEVQKTKAFWVFSLFLGLGGFYATAMFFHVIDIFAFAGYEKDVALSIFLPTSLLGMIINIVAGVLSDYFKLKYFALIALLALFVTTASFIMIPLSLTFLWLIIVAHALASGCYPVILTVLWPRYYGTKHMGEITGKVMSVLIIGSACGPYVFSLLKSETYGYAWGFGACSLVALILFFLCLDIDSPQAKTKQNTKKLMTH